MLEFVTKYRLVGIKILVLVFPFIFTPFIWIDIKGLTFDIGAIFVKKNELLLVVGLLVTLTSMLNLKSKLIKLLVALTGNLLIWLPIIIYSFNATLNKSYFTIYYFLFILSVIGSIGVQISLIFKNYNN